MMRSRTPWIRGIACTALLCLLQPALAQDSTLSPFAANVQRDTKWLSGYEDRSPGSPGHDAVCKGLLERIRALPNVKVWTHEFDMLMPIVEKAELTVNDGPLAGKHSIFPVWPALTRFSSTPDEGLSGRAIYVGIGAVTNLPARSLRNQIAVMEITGGANWQRVFAFGASAVVLLGSENERQYHTHSHLTDQPLNYPRFYVPDGRLAEAFRKGEIKSVRLFSRASWKPVKATNIYALVKPKEGAQPCQAIAVGAPFDAVSVTLGLAPAADAAVDAAVVLNLIERLAAQGAKRPVLLALVDAQGMNQRGVRHMLEVFAATVKDKGRFLKEDQDLLDTYEEHRKLVDELGTGPEALKKINALRYKPLHRYIKDMLSGELNDLDIIVPEMRIKVHKASGEEKETLSIELDRLTQRQNQCKTLHNQLLFKIPISEGNLPEALAVWNSVGERIRRQIAETKKQIDRYGALDRMREELLVELGLKGKEERPLQFLLGIDLSDAGFGCGPQLFCRHLAVDESRNADDFVRWLIRMRDTTVNPLWDARLRQTVNLAVLRPGESVQTYVVGNVPTFTSPALSFGLKAATWATLEGARLRVDTNRDRFELLDWSRLGPQVEATRLLVERLLEPTELQPKKGTIVSSWCRVGGSIVDRTPGDPVPKVPMQGYVTTLAPRRRTLTPATAGIRCTECVLTGTDGRFRFDAVPVEVHGELKGVDVESFKMTDNGRITRAVSKIEQASGLKQGLTLSNKPDNLTAMVFDCLELCTPPLLFDVRELRPLTDVTLRDALKRRPPTKSNITVRNGQLCALVPATTKWQVIARSGVTAPRMLLLNMRAKEGTGGKEESTGFDPLQPLPTIPEYIAAMDSWLVDESRLRSFRGAGISIRTIENIHARTKVLLDQADRAMAEDDGAGLFRAATSALANEVRAYQGVRNTADDVVRAAMFLLLGLLPFSIAMERLLFASPHIYKQILGTMGIFVAMCAALWSFHPAFRITSQPLMIVMAFLIIFLSAMVIMIVARRFESDLEKIRSGRAEESGAGTARGGLLSVALTIGIATMRKRKLRTALTGTTIALITFALLSFTSATNVLEYNKYELSSQPTYTGIHVQKPNLDPLSDLAVDFLEVCAGTNAVCVPRYWLVNRDPNWRLRLTVPGTDTEKKLKGGVAFSPAEGKISGIDEKLPDWDLFMKTGGCYLASETAEALGLKVGDRVVVGGTEYKFIGLFDPSLFRDDIKALTGESLAPLDFSSIDEDRRRSLYELKLQQAAQAMVQGNSEFEGIARLDPADMVLLPASQGLGSWIHSISVKTPSAKDAEHIAIDLTRRLDYPVYYSTGKGIDVLAASALLPTPPRSMLIPLIVAGFIIFNTMLNSIAERKKEIYIYTSLGLAPVHVGMIFLAEAVTYGLIGGIFGYIVGQGLATFFSHMGWMGSMTLNYSGTQVIQTMIMVLLVVIVSALVPAVMAGRLASPSEAMNWRLPKPEDGVIRDTLPFTVTHQASGGVLAFLHEYLDAHRDGTIGQFSSSDIRFIRPDEAAGHMGGVAATVWLAPYDLGVRQEMQIIVAPAEEDICDMRIQLSHRAGQLKNWYKLNRVFVSGLRNQMLGWRNVSAERVLAYISTARSNTPCQ